MGGDAEHPRHGAVRRRGIGLGPHDAASGAYINRMSDYCRGCRYDPRHRTGDDACPFTSGYWAFLHRNRERLAGNPRMAQPLHGLDRLADLDELVRRHDHTGQQTP
jgi:deoxyribodipyrimidine photolyase-related protein